MMPQTEIILFRNNLFTVAVMNIVVVNPLLRFDTCVRKKLDAPPNTIPFLLNLQEVEEK